MSVAERMAQRLATTSAEEQGAPCRHCATTALACQLGFVTLEEWCCPPCRREGAAGAHVEPQS
jgi:hypothetical protein